MREMNNLICIFGLASLSSLTGFGKLIYPKFHCEADALINILIAMHDPDAQVLFKMKCLLYN